MAQWLVRRSVRTAKASGLPYFLSTEKEQKGATFGERLSGAVEEVFAKGFQQVIIIGNDAPTLDAADLINAATELQSSSLGISPTAKGGVSLIGVSKEGFSKEAFSAIAWQTDKVADELVAFARAGQLSFTLLKEKDDINGHADIKKQLSARTCLPSFYLLLVSLLASLAGVFSSKDDFFFSNCQLRLFGLRAPPFC